MLPISCDENGTQDDKVNDVSHSIGFVVLFSIVLLSLKLPFRVILLSSEDEGRGFRCPEFIVNMCLCVYALEEEGVPFLLAASVYECGGVCSQRHCISHSPAR